MNDSEETPVHRLWQLFEERRWEEAGEQLQDDLVVEWPNVGHRFRGRDHFLAMNRAHPAPNWHIAVRRLLRDGNQVAAEVTVSSNDGVDVCLGFYELRDDRIARATEYWVERDLQPIPGWRANWTEVMSRDADGQ